MDKLKLSDETFNLISNLVDTHKKKIVKKDKTKFAFFFTNLVKMSKIFAHNCNNKIIFDKDINAALLSLGINKKK